MTDILLPRESLRVMLTVAFLLLSLYQLFTFGWREDIRPGEPLHTRKFCFDAVSHSSPVTLYDCHGMKGNQLWGHRKVRAGVLWAGHPLLYSAWGSLTQRFVLFNTLLSFKLPHEKEMAPHSSTLAWKIPWMEDPGRLQFMGSQRVGHD